MWDRIVEWIVGYGGQALGAIATLVIGYLLAGLARRVVKRLLARTELALALQRFVTQITYVGILVFAIVASLARFGVQTTSFVAILGAAGFAIGFALQGSLANFAAGVLLIIFRPLKVGDFVEAAGETGTVEEISIFTTQLKTPDNKTVIVPNAKLTGDNIVNYTVKGTRRVDMVVGVSYEADLDQTREVIAGVLAKDERILEDPPVQIAVKEMADSSVNFVVRPWTSADDYWGVYFDTQENVKKALDAAGIGIPFPQTDVHLYQHTTA